ncbi:phage tail tape measure protein [Perlucidibaca piscinae]|uniref:phage tail tape measure protein n=1 Tax=Perlucidibaca piscinae TaxID=392589 RepID=UPI0003B6BAAC|nr:phage tail tape measure protein [Perlucidibaca piscinae]
MTDRLKLQVLLDAIETVTAPLKKIQRGSAQTSAALQATRRQLRDLDKQQAKIDGFRQRQAALNQTLNDLQKARHQYKLYSLEVAASGPPTEAQATKLKRLASAADNLRLKQTRQVKQLADNRRALDEAGIATNRLRGFEKELKASVEAANAAMKKQEAQLATLAAKHKRLAAARKAYDNAMGWAGNAAATGAGLTAGGTAGLVPVVKFIKDYSTFEDAMLGVARQVQGARDANGKLTPTYFQLAAGIQELSKHLPIAATGLAALVEGGARMNIQGVANLLNFAETAAIMASAFDLPEDELGENMGRIAALYKIPIKNIRDLGDVINYLDDQALSKGGDIIDVLQRVAGVATTAGMDYRTTAALGSTFLSLGSSAEVAATATNAMIRELSIAENQSKRFMTGMDMLGMNPAAIQKGMAQNPTDTIINVLTAIQALSREKRLSAATMLFGDEFGDDAAKLSGNLAEYRRQLELVNAAQAKGSMQREADARNQTVSARWQMTQNRLFNTSGTQGGLLKGPLMGLLDTLDNVLERVDTWTKANPVLTATLLKGLAVISAIMVVMGGLTLALAAIIGPFAIMRLGMSLLGIQGFGAMTLLSKGIGLAGIALSGLFRIMLFNPVGLALTAIAIAVYAIYKNWDYLKAKGQEFLNWFTGLPERFRTMGSQMLDGLIGGINSKLASLKATITSVGTGAVGWFKERLGIHSPSRVFAELGGHTMAGLQIGLQGGTGGVLGQINRITGQLKTAGAGMALGMTMPALAGVPIDNRPAMSVQRSAGSVVVQGDQIHLTIQVTGGDPRQIGQAVERAMRKFAQDKAATVRSALRDLE